MRKNLILFRIFFPNNTLKGSFIFSLNKILKAKHQTILKLKTLINCQSYSLFTSFLTSETISPGKGFQAFTWEPQFGAL